jgi:hypothetical protein
MKLLVAAEYNNACFMALLIASFSAQRYILVVFLFSIRRAHRRATFERGRGLFDDSGLFNNMLLICLGGSMMGGEMGPVATR